VRHLPNRYVSMDTMGNFLTPKGFLGIKEEIKKNRAYPLTPSKMRELYPHKKGLGDRIERIVKPIAVALKMPCLDEQKQLKPDCGCAKRRDWLNKFGQKVGIGT
jgi:hypothetical protein